MATQSNFHSFGSLWRAVSLLSIAGGLTIAIAHPTPAQTTTAQTTPTRDANVYQNTQSGDTPTSGSFSSDGTNSMNTMFDLFHRAVLGVPRSGTEFGRERQQNIGNEASEFRRRQQELIQQRQSQPSGTSSTTPQANPNPSQPQ
ncbi:MAG: hypothetical protein MUF49_13740 [Oculatellaceae cyanobacterium Prado106]|jgi:hypothetical protein|nr:hypothetical protein [Oculatellaceae cyanobacterium Prado106]